MTVKLYLASTGLFHLCFGKKTQLCIILKWGSQCPIFHAILIISQSSFRCWPPQPITSLVFLPVLCDFGVSVCISFLRVVGTLSNRKIWEEVRDRPWIKEDKYWQVLKNTDKCQRHTAEKWIWGWQVGLHEDICNGGRGNPVAVRRSCGCIADP